MCISHSCRKAFGFDACIRRSWCLQRSSVVEYNDGVVVGVRIANPAEHADATVLLRRYHRRHAASHVMTSLQTREDVAYVYVSSTLLINSESNCSYWNTLTCTLYEDCLSMLPLWSSMNTGLTIPETVRLPLCVILRHFTNIHLSQAWHWIGGLWDHTLHVILVY